MKKTISIAGVDYTSISALQAAARARIPPAYTQAVTPLPLDQFWLDYFTYSPDFDGKAAEFGADLVFGYRLNPIDNGRTVGLVLTNSQSDPIKTVGWLACAKEAFNPGFVSPLPQRIRVGFRKAIKPQLEAYRRSKLVMDGRVYCEATGILYRASEIHIDHDPKSFEQIVDEFLGAMPTGTVFEGCLTKTNAGDEWHSRFIDRDVDEAFQQYHRQEATLRAVHGETINLTKPKWQK
jgi:hypothetical protein